MAAIVSYLHKPSVMMKWSGPASMKPGDVSQKHVGWPMVNLMVIAEDGIPFSRIGVPFVEGDLAPDGGYCKPRGAVG
ncbi:MAG: hypothetical protein EXS16_14950 [Gemmataceae bacterium]|nr:hypothetical protein [Gemmataceae bacterium]